MLKIGSIISNRVILAMTHKFVLAQCVEESPEPFTVWRLYDDMSGVYSGSYFKNKMDAEWEFCSLAFPWFQDNVNIQDTDEETAPEGQAQGLDKISQLIHRYACIEDEKLREFSIDKNTIDPVSEHKDEFYEAQMNFNILALLEKMNDFFNNPTDIQLLSCIAHLRNIYK